MSVTGIICEYNPLHLGHWKQLQAVRSADPEGGIVCVMSGNFVQRGMPALVDKAYRAKAALDCGADLVLELPVTACLSSAEGFAAEGVRILNGFCDQLSFGAEQPDAEKLQATAQALLSPAFAQQLKVALQKGCSFPAARQQALEAMDLDGSILEKPNNILAVEYCKAILSQNGKLIPCPIYRGGDYHQAQPDLCNPSATAVRQLAYQGISWSDYIPKPAADTLCNAPIHRLSSGEQAILAKLRCMSDEEFSSLPYGSEGLWRKLMANARSKATLEEILTATKSKRYTRTRLDRMVMCAFLSLTQAAISAPAPYTRVLALNDKGRDILRKARGCGLFVNTGEKQEHPYQQLENRCDDLYGLFAVDGPEAPGITGKRRIYYKK